MVAQSGVSCPCVNYCHLVILLGDFARISKLVTEVVHGNDTANDTSVKAKRQTLMIYIQGAGQACVKDMGGESGESLGGATLSGGGKETGTRPDKGQAFRPRLGQEHSPGKSSDSTAALTPMVSNSVQKYMYFVVPVSDANAISVSTVLPSKGAGSDVASSLLSPAPEPPSCSRRIRPLMAEI